MTRLLAAAAMFGVCAASAYAQDLSTSPGSEVIVTPPAAAGEQLPGVDPELLPPVAAEETGSVPLVTDNPELDEETDPVQEMSPNSVGEIAPAPTVE